MVLTNIISLAFLCILLSQCSADNDHGESTQTNLDVNGVSDILQQALKCHPNPGMAVSVVKDGQTIFSKGVGYENLETKRPVTEDTVFGIASITKSFTASLLVKLLLERTNFTLDSKIQDFLGDEFQMHDTFRTKEATFADVLAHRMAIPSNNFIRFDNNLTRDSLLKRLPLLPSNDQFRVKFRYSNLMYGLATVLAERLSPGITWEHLIQSHLLDPLVMNSTVFASTAALSDVENLATGYTKDGDKIVEVDKQFSRKWAQLSGSGAMMSTAKDMTHWMNFHLSQGLGPGGAVVMEADHIKEVHKARMLTGLTKSLELREPEFPVLSSQHVYAHGFRRGFYRSHGKLVHTGSTAGYKAIMTLLPSDNIGVFTAMSGEDDGYYFRSSLHYFLLDWALGINEPWLNESTLCSFPEPWRPAPSRAERQVLDTKKKPDLALEEFTGTYHNKAYGYLHVRFNRSLDSLTLEYGWGEWQLYYTEPLHQHLEFTGKAMGITTFWIRSMHFTQTSVEGKAKVSGVVMTSFEKSLPPVFSKLVSSSSVLASSLSIMLISVLVGLVV